MANMRVNALLVYYFYKIIVLCGDGVVSAICEQ